MIVKMFYFIPLWPPFTRQLNLPARIFPIRHSSDREINDHWTRVIRIFNEFLLDNNGKNCKLHSLVERLVSPNVSHAVDGPREVQVQHVPKDTDSVDGHRPRFVPGVHGHRNRYGEAQQKL